MLGAEQEGEVMDRKKAIVKIIRQHVGTVTWIDHSIPWYKPHLWKYKKRTLPRIGLKEASEMAEEILQVIE